MLFRQSWIAVAGAARIGQAERIDFRLGIGRRKNIVFAVAIAASGGITVAVHAGAAMNTVCINLGDFRMALLALRPLEFGRVRDLLDIAVTRGARQWRVRGFRKTLPISGRRDLFPVSFLLEAGR